MRTLKCKACGEEIQAGTQANHYRLKHPDLIKRKKRKYAKRTVALARRNGHSPVHQEPEVDDVFQSGPLTFSLGYATGRTEAQLETYARGIGVPQAELTSRVARLLLRAARGQVLGS